MRARLVRVALPLWVAFYFCVFHSVITVPLIFYLGPVGSAVLILLALGTWSSVFYFLLCQEGWMDKAQFYLARLKKKLEQGLLGRVRRQFSEQLPGEPLLSPLWVLVVFVMPGSGAFWGVLAVRLAYPVKVSRKAWVLIWLGCAINVFWVVLGLGLLISLAREHAGVIFGGG